MRVRLRDTHYPCEQRLLRVNTAHCLVPPTRICRPTKALLRFPAEHANQVKEAASGGSLPSLGFLPLPSCAALNFPSSCRLRCPTCTMEPIRWHAPRGCQQLAMRESPHVWPHAWRILSAKYILDIFKCFSTIVYIHMQVVLDSQKPGKSNKHP